MKNFNDLGATVYSFSYLNKFFQYSYSYQGFNDTLKMYCKNFEGAVEKNHLVGFCVAKIARKKEGKGDSLCRNLGVVAFFLMFVRNTLMHIGSLKGLVQGP
jgi:hypothetical protein